MFRKIPANNLSWLRLAFAAQVVVLHTAGHVGGYLPPFLGYFPGVPAFFFVSGFLIYSAFVGRDGAGYWRNRFVRLFPALFVVTVGALAIVLIAKGWGDLISNPATYATWFVAQITLGQAYNPGHFRDVGVGVINGSLWTLTTEILFYVAVPIIVWLERRFKPTVLVLTALSFGIYAFGPGLLDQAAFLDKTLFELLALTPVVWGWMFGLGILAFKHFDRIPLRWLPVSAIPLLAMIAFGNGPLFGASGNNLGLVYFTCYAALILWLAFGTRVFRLEADFSYGTYVWHMPVINLLIVLGIPNPALVFVLTALMAGLSWYLVEKPANRFRSGGRPAGIPVGPVGDVPVVVGGVDEAGPGDGASGRDAVAVAP